MNNITEARSIVLEHLEPLVKSHGFTVKTNSAKQAKIERKSVSGKDVFSFDLLNYNPSYKIRYAFNKVNTSINSVLVKLSEQGLLSMKEHKDSWFLFFSYNTLFDPTETSYLPIIETEEDVKRSIGMIASFLGETALPLLGKFEDLREVDLIINNNNPWESDWHMPYVFGSNFHIKRLIISKLAGLGSYQRVYDYLGTFYTSRFDDEYGSDYKIAMKEVEAANKELISIAPLY